MNHATGKSEVELEMKEAQRLWDAKNSTGICTSVTISVTNAGKRVLESIDASSELYTNTKYYIF